MQDFKDKKALNPVREKTPKADSPLRFTPRLDEERAGWYEGQLDFKRVVLIPQTGKFEYKDAHVVYQCKAMSPLDCYDRILEHVRSRVDRRSQFPSAKGKGFKFKYLGMWK